MLLFKFSSERRSWSILTADSGSSLKVPKTALICNDKRWCLVSGQSVGPAGDGLGLGLGLGLGVGEPTPPVCSICTCRTGGGIIINALLDLNYAAFNFNYRLTHAARK